MMAEETEQAPRHKGRFSLFEIPSIKKMIKSLGWNSTKKAYGTSHVGVFVK